MQINKGLIGILRTFYTHEFPDPFANELAPLKEQNLNDIRSLLHDNNDYVLQKLN